MLFSKMSFSLSVKKHILKKVFGLLHNLSTSVYVSFYTPVINFKKKIFLIFLGKSISKKKSLSLHRNKVVQD